MYGPSDVHEEITEVVAAQGRKTGTVTQTHEPAAEHPTTVITWTNHDGRVFEIYLETREV